MKNISISELRRMTVQEIKEGPSFNVVADGEFVAIVVVPASAEKRAQFQSLADQGSKALGFKD